MFIIYNDYIKNLIPGSLVITNEDPAFPADNLMNESADIVCKTTGISDQTLSIDLGESRAPKFFGIINHNFVAGGYVYIKVGDDTIASIELLDLDGYVYLGDAPNAAQNWVFDFSDVSVKNTSDGGLSLGRIIIAADYDIELIPDYDCKLNRSYEFKNIINISTQGVKWTYALAARINHFRLTWNARTGTTLRTMLRTLCDAVNGNAHPFVLLPNESSTEQFEPALDIHYVYIGDPIVSWAELYDSVYIGEAAIELITAPRIRSEVIESI